MRVSESRRAIRRERDEAEERERARWKCNDRSNELKKRERK